MPRKDVSDLFREPLDVWNAMSVVSLSLEERLGGYIGGKLV